MKLIAYCQLCNGTFETNDAGRKPNYISVSDKYRYMICQTCEDRLLSDGGRLIARIKAYLSEEVAE